MKHLFILLFSLICATSQAQTLERVSPESVGLDATRLQNADAAINKAIGNKNIPVPCSPWCAMARWPTSKPTATSASIPRTSP